MLKKEFFSYEYMTTFERLKETQFPSKQAFYSSIIEKDKEENEYQHAQTIWIKFDCKTMKDYLLLYFRTDVAL